jgi:bacillithiol system protein YtxJ
MEPDREESNRMGSFSSPEDFERFIAARGSGFIFKHSTRCDISSAADAALLEFLERRPEVPVYKVLVIESRPVSIAIAEGLGIPHASPQAILVRDGKPIWNASHWEITPDALESAWSES